MTTARKNSIGTRLCANKNRVCKKIAFIKINAVLLIHDSIPKKAPGFQELFYEDRRIRLTGGSLHPYRLREAWHCFRHPSMPDYRSW
jgi:hypothetical protein